MAATPGKKHHKNNGSDDGEVGHGKAGLSSIVNNGGSDDGGGTSPFVTILRTGSTVLDIAGWAIDFYDAGVVTVGGIVGTGIAAPFALGGPEVPAVTGLAGVAIAELYVQPGLRIANVLSFASTGLTILADIVAGDTNIKQGLAPTTLNSITTTAIGAAAPEAYISLVVQSVAVSNDLGWISFPFPNRSK